MKKIILYYSLVSFLLSCKKSDINPVKNTTNVNDTIQTSIAKYGGGITDIDGNNYRTVIIGKQEWMCENLKVSKYNDGKIVPNVNGDSNWKNLNSGAWCNLKNSDSLGKIYGKLYNWYAVDTKKLCPSGWHVPTYDEWLVLAKTLDINFNVEDNSSDTIVAKALKVTGTKYWESPNTATNSSLFTALPAGYFKSLNISEYSDGFIDNHANWWTTFNSNGFIVFFGIDYDTFCMKSEEDIHKTDGKSVRCIKD